MEVAVRIRVDLLTRRRSIRDVLAVLIAIKWPLCACRAQCVLDVVYDVMYDRQGLL